MPSVVLGDDFTPEDEMLLSSLFPMEGAPSMAGVERRVETEPRVPSSKVIAASVVIAMVVAIVGVDVGCRRLGKRAPQPGTAGLAMIKLVAGLACFYLVYETLQSTLQPSSTPDS